MKKGGWGTSGVGYIWGKGGWGTSGGRGDGVHLGEGGMGYVWRKGGWGTSGGRGDGVHLGEGVRLGGKVPRNCSELQPMAVNVTVVALRNLHSMLAIDEEEANTI